mmetsp:Transcript_14390/g.38519  ORF Transcript_14390/g.38519 Transcript_14390/m.38519 type:complete len:241 (-) Transcript_14390:985-1707(-)
MAPSDRRLQHHSSRQPALRRRAKYLHRIRRRHPEVRRRRRPQVELRTPRPTRSSADLGLLELKAHHGAAHDGRGREEDPRDLRGGGDAAAGLGQGWRLEHRLRVPVLEEPQGWRHGRGEARRELRGGRQGALRGRRQGAGRRRPPERGGRVQREGRHQVGAHREQERGAAPCHERPFRASGCAGEGGDGASHARRKHDLGLRVRDRPRERTRAVGNPGHGYNRRRQGVFGFKGWNRSGRN